MAGLTVGALLMGGTLVRAEAVVAGFADVALRVGDAKLVDNLALAGHTSFTGAAISAGLAGGLGCNVGFAGTTNAGLTDAALLVSGATQATPTTMAGRSAGALLVVLANSVVDAEAIFAAMTGVALLSCGAGEGIVAVRRVGDVGV